MFCSNLITSNGDFNDRETGKDYLKKYNKNKEYKKILNHDAVNWGGENVLQYIFLNLNFNLILN